MDLTEVAHRRLATQRLVGQPFTDVATTVRELLAVQSQDFGPAGWSIAQRCGRVAAVDFLSAFDAGEVLRTHVLRPTWHLVHPEDLRWLLALTAPRVHQLNGHMYRRLELDPATLDRATEVIVSAVDGVPLTRNQLGERLAAEGIQATGQRLAYIAMHAELEQAICSGPMDGKQHTYTLVDDRVPASGPVDRDKAVADLTLRFFASHGPATLADLRAWSSLTLADLRGAIADLGDQLTSVEVVDRTFHLVDSPAPPAPPTPLVRLLQPYDEYLSGASDSSEVHDPDAWITTDPLPRFAAMLLVDGHVIGSWRRTVRRDHVTVEVAPLVGLDRDQRAALDAEAARLAGYLGIASAEVVMVEP